MSTEPTRDPVPGTESMSTAEAIPAPEPGMLSSVEPPTTTQTTDVPASPAVQAEATTPTATTAAAPAAPAVVTGPTRGTRALVAVRRLIRFAFATALLALGIYIGWQTYLNGRPAPVTVANPSVEGIATPPAVVELATAIGADDANAIRVALPAEMFNRFTADMERYGIVTVDDTQTLATYADGPRTATALVINGRTADGNPFTINLVVIAQDGTIVRLR